MLRSFRTVSVMMMLALSGCAGASTAPERSAARPGLTVDQRVAELESALGQLRNQHAAMGETIQRLETRITVLRQVQLPAPLPIPAANTQATETPATPPPAPAAAEPAKPAEAQAAAPAEKAEPSGQAAAPAASTAASTQEPEQRLATVTGLTDADIATEAPKPAEQPAAVPDSGYLLHVASYLHEAQVKTGWAQLSSQYAKALEGTMPYTTEFTDGRGRHWWRLHAGVFVREAEAKDRCGAIKAAGGWCEVQAAHRADVKSVE